MDTASIMTVVVIIVFSWFQSAIGYTDPNDVSALTALKNEWQNAPPTWARSDDPCGSWEGITCMNSRITVMRLSTMGIKGTLTGDLWLLTELQSLDLSYNKDLGGPLSSKIENLKKLNTLILIGCSFIGTIPAELGTLSQLKFLSLNSNKFTGTIPDSLGNLSNLYWLDIADNGLTGNIPVSSASSSGLDKLVNTRHFHFNKNQLSGEIPATLFNSDMNLLHLLLDGNKFTGKIPDTIGLLGDLEVLRLDRNRLSGPVPSSINNLTSVNELNLANNLLTGMVPNLSRLGKLNYVDLSNNSFAGSEVPSWFSTLPITTLVVQSGGLMGEIPQRLFSNFQLQQVILSRNKLNGTLDMRGSLNQQLQLVDLQDNDISYFTQGDMGKVTIILIRNPVCNNQPANTRYCALQLQESKPYSTGLAQCAGKTCPADQNPSPNSCACAYPYKGIMIFRAPTFSDLTNRTLFQQLEEDLWKKLGLSPGSVSIQNIFFNSDSYLQLDLELFPSDGIYFNRSEILHLGFSFSNQSFKPAHIFGPYFFIASPYPFPEESSGKSAVSTSVIIAIAIGCTFLIMIFVALGIYAFQQKKRAEKAEETSQPFAAWTSSFRDSNGPPQLKGARLFSFNDLNKCTNYFSQNNEIGGGGYGKVYRGTLPSGQLVAIKRAQQGSTQGPKEFKTEIELLSRVHHKNLVCLVGFCADHGEQMLVYEFIPNGTIRDSLSGKSGIVLDWKRRLRVALGSAKGLAYLHELADPPIIHRDVKSSNILLDVNLNAKVADFGLSKLISESEKGHISTQVKGTMGYLDPEYYMTQQLTDKSDVYSFGVVMLELLTGKQPLQKGKYVVREARMMLDRNKEYYGLRDILDPIIRDAPNPVDFDRFVDLALRCVEETATNRPTMNEVVKEIEAMLQQDGSNPTSASSSATELVNAKGAQSHPYKEPSTSKEKDSNSGTFGYIFPARVEPK